MGKKWKIAAVCAGVPILLIIALIIVVHTYDYNRLKPRIESAVHNATGRELTMAGDINLDFGFSPALVVERVALQNAEWGSEPKMLSCERFELKVALLPLITGDVSVKRLILVRPVMLVEKSKQGTFNYEFDTGAEKERKQAPEPKEEKETGQALPGLEVNRVRIDGAELVYKDHATDSGFTASLDRMRASAESMSAPLDFDLQGAFKEAPFSLSGEIGSLQDLMRGRKMPFSLRAELAGTRTTIQGNRTASGQKNGFSARVDVSAKSLKGINKLAGTDLPTGVPIGLTTAVGSPDMEKISVDGLQLDLGESTVKGAAKLDLGGSVPSLRASLQSDELDLRPFVSRESASSGGEKAPLRKGPEGNERIFPDTPLAADFLRGMDAALQMDIGSLLVPQLRAGNIRMDLGLANGELRVDPLRLEMADGSLDGKLGFRDLKQGVALTTNMEIRGLQLKKLMAMAGKKDVLRGELETSLDLAARGRDVAGLMGAMNGEAVVIVDQGRLDSAYLDELGGNVFGTLRRYIDPEKKSGEYTRINCFVTAFDMNKGMARSRVFLMDTSGMQILADGSLDLGTERLDFSFDPRPKEGLDSGTTGKISSSISELSKPFKLAGTLANPSLALDIQSAALTLGKAIGGASEGGLAGAASALLGGSGDEQTTCDKAVAVARGEEKPAAKQPAEKQDSADEGSTEGSTVEKGLKDLEKGVRDLF